MSDDLSKHYDPAAVQDAIYQTWLDAGAFSADPTDDRRSFCMVIPPPNVTAALHLGHALNNTLQDVLIRYRRMSGCNTLWMPGTDHAGIATQTVVEKRLLAEEGKRRTEYDREEFVGRVQAWKDDYEARILGQLQKMGCSCDWDRTRFTMDAQCAAAVRETFFRLFRDGLIYRGKRLVNWDPATQTVLADDEVEHQDIDGHFWYLNYPLVEPVTIDGQTLEYVTVATTRPETMLGDTAVAMNPKDPRAESLVGKTVRLPIVGREIPIIADDHVVLPDPDSDDDKAKFSTGFLKVTPAHDPDDYQIGQRHDLPMINVMAPDGSISRAHGWDDWDALPESNRDVLDEWVIGKDRFEAREAIVDFFRQEKLMEKVADYKHSVGHSYRSHVPIEPYLSDQWYVAVKAPIPGLDADDILKREHKEDESGKNRGDDIKTIADEDGNAILAGTDVPVTSLAGLALTPLLSGRLRFTPDRYAENYRTWLENLRDWPISRQLWWGHQIPVWSQTTEDRVAYVLQGNAKQIINAIQGRQDRTQTAGHLTYKGTQYYFQERHNDDNTLTTFLTFRPGDSDTTVIAQLESEGWQRDPDVLDTWFSSALWPFSTLGWPEQTPELAKFYPGDVLSTAREIITLWVSRMVMMGQYCCEDIPFSEVFIHAMIQDGQGRKMSKSLGNGVDPLEVIDSHGADAMRYTLVSMTTQTQDVRMPLEKLTLPDGREVNSSPKFDIGRNLANKLWNAGRFVLGQLIRCPRWEEIRPTDNLSDAWFISRLNAAVRDCTLALEEYRFNELAERLYHFFWDDFCDWYVEIAKVRIAAGDRTPRALLAHGLDVILRLFHPTMPFLTEQLWTNLNRQTPTRGPGDTAAEDLLILAEWPRADGDAIDPLAESAFELLRDLIRQVRNIRTQHNVPPSQKIKAIAEVIEGTGECDIVTENRPTIEALAGLETLEISYDAVDPPANAGSVTARGVKLYVLDVIDTAAERSRLEKQLATLEKGIRGVEGKLGNEKFLANAPAEIVQQEQGRLDDMQRDIAAVRDALAKLG
jgi:valyl-tRNA synthetase